METALKRHGVLVLHLLIMALLLIGLVQRTQLHFLPQVSIYIGVLLAGYALLNRLVPGFRRPAAPSSAYTLLFIRAVLIAQVVQMIAHWAWLGGIPLWEALHEQDDLRIVEIRRAAGEGVPLLLDYFSHFLIKALVPMALLLAWSTNRRLFWLLAVCASVYAASLLAKSFFITLFVPLLLALLVTRQWRYSAVLVSLFLVVTVLLSTAANPQKLRSRPAPGTTGQSVAEDAGVKEHGFVLDALLGVGRRVVLMPGWTVAEWFTHIPSGIPYAKGGAVRPLAVALGVPYTDYTEKVYDLAYPEMAAKHVPGTMGSAAFMYGYANFGTWGLFAAGLVTAVLLLAVQRVYGDQWKWSVVLNAFPLLSLSGSALPTVLLTHGWGLTILLFLWLRPAHEPAA